MSEEFVRVATQEISQELDDISLILQSCKGDDDVAKNSEKIEKHMHKIKGLAPMMGKESVGDLAKVLDSVLKHIKSGKKIKGFFDPLTISVEQMKIAMKKNHDLTQIQKKVNEISLKMND